MTFLERIKAAIMGFRAGDRRYILDGDPSLPDSMIRVRYKDLMELYDAFVRLDNDARHRHGLMMRGETVLSVSSLFSNERDGVMNVMLMQAALAGYVPQSEPHTRGQDCYVLLTGTKGKN